MDSGRYPIGEDIAEFSKIVAVRLLKLKSMAGKALDLGAAFKLPDFTLGEQKFKSFGEFLEAWEEELKAKWEKFFAELYSGLRTVVNGMDAIFGQFHENQARRLENEEKQQTDAIENWYERERGRIEATIANEEEKVAALEALDEEKARKENALQHKMDKERRKLERARAKSQKAGAMFAAGINVAEAITKALSQGGFLLGAIMSGVVAALGAVQIAAIAAAPLPALEKGGRIGREGGIVGERGAELFVPERPGTIIPLHGGTRMGALTVPRSEFKITVNQTINAKTLDDYTISRAAEKIFAAVDREKRRRGY